MYESRFTSTVEVGSTVTGETRVPKGVTEWSGVYEGVRPSEWDNEPTHFFRDGIMGVTPQGLFGIPVGQFRD